MLKIFVPEKIFEKFRVNFFDESIFSNFSEIFENFKIKDFKTKFITGTYFELDEDEDFLIFCNGYFGKKYFFEYDFTKKYIFTFGKSFYSDKNYFSDLKNIENEILSIKDELNSDKLLTNTKKKELKEKIDYTFFLISGVYFHLYFLLEKTNENILELENIDSKGEYEATASMIAETAKTKKIELESIIGNFETKIKYFYEIITKFYVL